MPRKGAGPGIIGIRGAVQPHVGRGAGSFARKLRHQALSTTGRTMIWRGDHPFSYFPFIFGLLRRPRPAATGGARRLCLCLWLCFLPPTLSRVGSVWWALESTCLFGRRARCIPPRHIQGTRSGPDAPGDTTVRPATNRCASPPHFAPGEIIWSISPRPSGVALVPLSLSRSLSAVIATVSSDLEASMYMRS